MQTASNATEAAAPQRPLNDTIPEIRWMKEERRGEKERLLGKFSSGILVGRFGRGFGQVPPKQHHQISIS